jgi:hypothetical protein
LQSSPAVAVHAYSNFPRQGNCINAASARLVETTPTVVCSGFYIPKPFVSQSHNAFISISQEN